MTEIAPTQLVHAYPTTTGDLGDIRCDGTEGVTVIMPVYNGESFVEDAVRSVLTQTLLPTQIIVVDDGSTDRTREILATFGDAIQVMWQNNGGHASARNAAVKVSTGTWIAMLDADDLWEPTKLQRQMEHASSADVMYTAVTNFEDSQRVDDETFQNHLCPNGDVFQDLLLDNFITHSSIVMRRSEFLNVGGYDESLRTTCDWDLWLRMSENGCRFQGIAEPLTHYRWRSTSNSKNHSRTSEDRFTVLSRALQTRRAEQVSRRIHRAAVSSVWSTSAWFAAEKDDRMALKWYLKSVQACPYNIQSWKEIVRCCAHLCGISRSRFFGRREST